MAFIMPAQSRGAHALRSAGKNTVRLLARNTPAAPVLRLCPIVSNAVDVGCSGATWRCASGPSVRGVHGNQPPVRCFSACAGARRSCRERCCTMAGHAPEVPFGLSVLILPASGLGEAGSRCGMGPGTGISAAATHCFIDCFQPGTCTAVRARGTKSDCAIWHLHTFPDTAARTLRFHGSPATR